ncbi:MerR family transcriptional regulator [Companilactobacillus nantensis]|uniref:HTH merR-type domain-containing protein n=1 Tax=Companilactobacillus nantensis DSM 16982 TaxID=1423774 RepID=A0A0R1WBP9_9LACO|nr:MerR family transcriptional regulator [Companilactobacillus nantensis]KRM15271.1 hypothetical protein FD31_GL001279 [Companilactobacillus nantensis DSM 16982]GEO64400.1 MerR family transcriptional regulator [Companilactobacillus nantensis]
MTNINPFSILKNVALGSTQVAHAAGVTSRQLRYWETQGYIKSLPEMVSNTRQYNLATVIKVMAIKQGLDSGLSLSGAVEAAKNIRDQSNYIGRFISETYQGYQQNNDGTVTLDFGSVKDHPEEKVTGVIGNKDSYFKITK